jgi:hypothetical protein
VTAELRFGIFLVFGYAVFGLGESKMDKRKKLLLGGIVVMLVAGSFFGATGIYSALQLRSLKAKGIYTSPEEGMRLLIEKSYSEISRVEIVHAGREMFDDLCYVEGHVWAANRRDGKGFKDRDYDNPGSFFLRVRDGWVFVPEGKFPGVIAFGRWLFGID